MNSSKEIKIGSLLSYLQMGLYVIIGILYTPIMIRLLGKSEYGLYSTVSSTIAMLSVLSLGFNSSYIRYYSKYKKESPSRVKSLNGLYLLIFLVIGIVALFCGVFLSNHLNIVFDKGLTDSEYSIAKILMILLSINLSLSFPISVFHSIIAAHEKFVVLKSLGMIKTVLSPLLTMPLLLSGYKSIGMVTVTLIVNAIVDVIFVFYVLVKLKERFVFKDFEKGIFRDIFAFTFFIALNIVVDQINMNVDKMLLGRFLGTTSVAVYTVGFSLYQYYQAFSTSISTVFTPRVHRIYNENLHDEKERNRKLTEVFVKVGRVQFFLLGLILSGVVIFGKSFIYFWAGEGYEQSYYVAIMLMVPATIDLIQNIGIEIQRAENKHNFRSITYVIMAIVNFGLTIWLCQVYGVIGATFGTAISFIIANGIIVNIYYHKKCGLNVILFWKNIISMSKGMVIPLFLVVLMIKIIPPNTLLTMIAEIIVYSVLYLSSFWFISLNKSEKRLIKEPIRKVLNKIKFNNKNS